MNDQNSVNINIFKMIDFLYNKKLILLKTIFIALAISILLNIILNTEYEANVFLFKDDNQNYDLDIETYGYLKNNNFSYESSFDYIIKNLTKINVIKDAFNNEGYSKYTDLFIDNLEVNQIEGGVELSIKYSQKDPNMKEALNSLILHSHQITLNKISNHVKNNINLKKKQIYNLNKIYIANLDKAKLELQYQKKLMLNISPKVKALEIKKVKENLEIALSLGIENPQYNKEKIIGEMDNEISNMLNYADFTTDLNLPLYTYGSKVLNKILIAMEQTEHSYNITKELALNDAEYNLSEFKVNEKWIEAITPLKIDIENLTLIYNNLSEVLNSKPFLISHDRDNIMFDEKTGPSWLIVLALALIMGTIVGIIIIVCKLVIAEYNKNQY